jgi:hypothetical protein
MTGILFLCYDPSKSQGGGIHSWYDQQDGTVRAAIDATLELLALERNWSDLPHFKELRGACEGLSEIRIVNLEDGRLIRILGFEGPGKREYTLLFPFEKPGGFDYTPHCHSAHWRKQGVIRDSSRAAPCQFP